MLTVSPGLELGFCPEVSTSDERAVREIHKDFPLVRENVLKTANLK